MLRWLVATLHLLALPLGAAAWWGVAALLWLGTGLWRAFGGLEKGTGYYLANPVFHAKLGLFVAVVLLEIWPMVTPARWRRALRAGSAPDLRRAPALARISAIQLAMVVAILFLATAMARGPGL